MPGKRSYFALALALAVGWTCSRAPEATKGPLRVHPDNPHYFTDDGARAVYLTGSHTWPGIVDMGPGPTPAAFDFDAYLDWTQRYGHNFIRLWAWELLNWDTAGNSSTYSQNTVLTVTPHPWLRSGPEKTLDGKPKFDLEKLNPKYFQRLRSRVEAAEKRGIYVSVMLFEGWGIRKSPGAWENHPFHPDNNINGLDGDTNSDGQGIEIHTLTDPAVTAIQEAYVREVIDTVNELDNVLYEIINEAHPTSTDWQYHMIDFVHDYERTKPTQHPVGMTAQRPKNGNEALFDGPADWISPDGDRNDPQVADARKVILSDTDHLWGIGGSEEWVWKTFLGGMNTLFMDPYDAVVLGESFDPQWEPVRRSMGYTLAYARRMNLAAMSPSSPWWKSRGPHSERRGVECEATRGRRCAGIVDERQQSSRRRAVRTPWARGGYGRRTLSLVGVDAPHRLFPRLLAERP